MAGPSGRSGWVSRGRVVALAESRPNTPANAQRVADLMGKADRACSEYPKHQQRTVWGWFIEGRFGDMR